MRWINTVNTTALRIIVSILLAVVHSTTVLLAMCVWGWRPDPLQLKVLTGIALSILTMMGFDVLQFAAKRFSDAGYAAAKRGTTDRRRSPRKPRV
jgi:hypothetical protein